MSTPVTNANVVTFITSDPRSVGFAAIRAANPGADAPLLAAANNPSGPGAGTVAGDAITPAALSDLISASEWNTMTAAQYQALADLKANGTILVGNAPTQAKLNLLFADYPTSLAAIQATYTRAAGPWETYFGKGSLATTALLDAARNSNGGSQF